MGTRRISRRVLKERVRTSGGGRSGKGRWCSFSLKRAGKGGLTCLSEITACEKKKGKTESDLRRSGWSSFPLSRSGDWSSGEAWSILFLMKAFRLLTRVLRGRGGGGGAERSKNISATPIVSQSGRFKGEEDGMAMGGSAYVSAYKNCGSDRKEVLMPGAQLGKGSQMTPPLCDRLPKEGWTHAKGG